MYHRVEASEEGGYGKFETPERRVFERVIICSEAWPAARTFVISIDYCWWPIYVRRAIHASRRCCVKAL